MSKGRFESDRPFAPYLGVSENQKLKSPFRQPTPQSDWLTPLLQSLTIAGLVGCLFGGAIWLADAEYLKEAIKVGIVVFLIAITVSFVWLMNRAHRSLYHTIEHRPYKPPEDHRPIVQANKGPYRNPQEAPATVDDATPEALDRCPWPVKTMKWFVWWCEEKGTGYDVWEGALGRKRYTAWRDGLLRAGWAKWNSYGPDGRANNTQGWHLDAPADQICDHISQES